MSIKKVEYEPMMFEQTGTLFCMPNYTILPDFEAWLELRQKQEIVLYIPKGSCTLWEFPNATLPSNVLTCDLYKQIKKSII